MNLGAAGLATVLLLCCGVEDVLGAKILALLNLPSPSHYIFNRPLLLALAERGHQVTVISADMEKRPVQNLNSIVLEGIYNFTRQTYDFESYIAGSTLDMISEMYDYGTVVCEKELQTEGAQKLLNSPSTERFDLIITEVGWGECFFAFIHKFGSPPVVATSGVGIPPWLSITSGNPENPSYMPNFLLPHTSDMSFSERIYNFVIHWVCTLWYEYDYIPKQDALARKYFKEDFPPFTDVERNFSIYLVNTAFGYDNPRPLLPNVIPVGGMHIKEKPDILPKDLKVFLDEAKEGFIFFSLGSNVQSDQLSPHKRQALLDAFSDLQQRVLWKFETDNLLELPPNVKISKWLPQSDILAHPNIRMFITHCGLLSSLESTYWGVPIVGVPFFLDQKLQLKKMVKKGVGVPLDYLTITKENVLEAVRKVLNNESYHNNMKKLSAVFRDQPQSALQRAVYWTEYVIRHNGAPHLRTAAMDLYWHQYLLLDVLLVLAIGVLSIVVTMYLIIRKLYRTVKVLKQSSKQKSD